MSWVKVVKASVEGRDRWAVKQKEVSHTLSHSK